MSLRAAAVAKWSLALIGNASAGYLDLEEESRPEAFSEETRRRRLAFAADAVRYGFELMTLECFDEKETQCRYLVDHSGRRQLALSQQIAWQVRSSFRLSLS